MTTGQTAAGPNVRAVSDNEGSIFCGIILAAGTKQTAYKTVPPGQAGESV